MAATLRRRKIIIIIIFLFVIIIVIIIIIMMTVVQQAALKAISDRLVTEKKGNLPGGSDAKERIQMWVSSLSANDPTSSYEGKAAEVSIVWFPLPFSAS